MENPIKKVFDEKLDEDLHNEFVKFGKGTFDNRYKIEVTSQKGGTQFKINTTPEFSNYFVKKCLNKIRDGIKVSGIIISTYSIEEDVTFPLEDTKKYMGMTKYIIDTEVEKDKLLELMEKHPRVFYGLSFSEGPIQLKIRKKSPRSAKPGKSGEKGKQDNFCSLKTQDKELVKDLLFDVTLNFDKAKITHDIVIEDVQYPDNFKELLKTKKPKEIRDMSKRKGKVVRKIDIDGKKEEKEKEFLI